ncbi:MAG: AAA family ATPase [Acholeplasmataceae bacterium]
MIKQISARNFKSLCDITIDFTVKGKIQETVFIYGENGSGKSNIVETVMFLKKSFDSMSNVAQVQKAFENFDDLKKYGVLELFKGFELEQMIVNHRTVGASDLMVLKYSFQIEKKDYIYELFFDQTKIVKETLYGILSKNKVMIFNIETKGLEIFKYFAKDVFSKDYQTELEKLIDKYFGKNTFMAIYNNEFILKNEAYVINNSHKQMYVFYSYLLNLMTLNNVNMVDNLFNESSYLLDNVLFGFIDEDQMNLLKSTREIVKLFLLSLYADVKDVYYKYKIVDDRVQYELIVKKMIGGKLREISVKDESTGTRQLLNLVPTFAQLFNHGVVVVDEIDTGIHDLLMIEVVKAIKNSSNLGQLIVTTHNTKLLDVLNKEDVFIIDTDDKGYKKVLNLTQYDIKLQKNHSLYSKYISGSFGGTPSVGYVDFDDVFNLEDDEELIDA